MLALKPTIRLLSVVPLLCLAACGEGWEKQDTHMVPYTMERTAGTGLAYVRAKMMPARGPVVEEAAEEEVMSHEMKTDLNTELYMEVQDEPDLDVQTGDEIFDDSQRK